MGILVLVKQQQYIKLIKKLVKNNAPLKELEDAYLAYKKLCFDNGLKDDLDIKFLTGERFIIPKDVEQSYIDDSKVSKAVEHLKEALKTNDGISFEEAELILKWVTQNTRFTMYEDSLCDSASHLQSFDDLAQAVSALPFINANIPITINNARSFGSIDNHSFITVKMPICEANNVVIKQFLIDLTYIRFFSFPNATSAAFYSKSSGFKPSVGYYVCQSEEGIKLATELVRKGYIELNAQNVEIYCGAFECKKFIRYNYEGRRELTKSASDYYLDIINNNSGKLSYQGDSIEIGDLITTFPKEQKIKKYE